ncbi:protein of unknown function (plasmid) [Caballeronia sp. S22]
MWSRRARGHATLRLSNLLRGAAGDRFVPYRTERRSVALRLVGHEDLTLGPFSGHCMMHFLTELLLQLPHAWLNIRQHTERLLSFVIRNREPICKE